MRNPFRSKNWRPRMWPAFGLGALALLVSTPDERSLVMGLPVVAVGLGLRSWGAGHLVKNEAFVCTGPYAHVRHPLSLGTLCIGTGFALALGGGVGVAVWVGLLAWFFLSYFPRKERVESQRLRERYGDVYERYRTEVDALWPALRPWPTALDVADDVGWRASHYDDNNELGTLIATLVGAMIVAGWAIWRV